MKINSVHLRRFRSVARASLADCGGLNVLIGKNNAGKSNLLTAIELTLRHLDRGNIAGSWLNARPKDDFTDRDVSKPIRIGIELGFTPDFLKGLQARLHVEAPHLDRAIQQLEAHHTLAIVLCGISEASASFLYIERIAAGKIDASNEDLRMNGINLLAVTPTVAAELFQIQQEITQLREDQDTIFEAINNRRGLEFAVATPGRGYKPPSPQESIEETRTEPRAGLQTLVGAQASAMTTPFAQP